MAARCIRMTLALLCSVVLGASEARAEEPSERHGEVPDSAVDAESTDGAVGETTTALVFLGRWAKHRVYVAVATRIRHGSPDEGDDTRWEWAVIPASFDELRMGREASSQEVRLQVAPATAAELGDDLGKLRAVALLKDPDTLAALRDLGIEEFDRSPLEPCGIEAHREARGVRIGWRPPGAGTTIGSYERGIQEQCSCYALADGTLAVSVHEADSTAAGPPPVVRLLHVRPRAEAYDFAVAAAAASGSELVPLGFSPRGRFGWIEIGPGGAASSIVDLVNDAPIERREWRASGGGDRALPGPAVAEVPERARAAGLLLPMPEATRGGVHHDGDAFEAWIQEERDGGCGVYLERRDDYGLKRVALLPPDVARGGPEIRGVFLSPHEPRAAIVVSYARGEGPAGVRFAAYGAHLVKGFPPRASAGGTPMGWPAVRRSRASVFDSSGAVELPPRFPLPLRPAARVVSARSEGRACKARSYLVRLVVESRSIESVDAFYDRVFRDRGLLTRHTRGGNYVATQGTRAGVEAEVVSSSGATTGARVSVRWSPTVAGAHELGLAAYDRGRYDEAARLLSSAVVESPRSAAAHYDFARAYHLWRATIADGDVPAPDLDPRLRNRDELAHIKAAIDLDAGFRRRALDDAALTSLRSTVFFRMLRGDQRSTDEVRALILGQSWTAKGDCGGGLYDNTLQLGDTAGVFAGCGCSVHADPPACVRIADGYRWEGQRLLLVRPRGRIRTVQLTFDGIEGHIEALDAKGRVVETWHERSGYHGSP